MKGKQNLIQTIIYGGFFLVVLLGASFFGVERAQAATQTITASGVYLMGEDDTPRKAKEAARKEAMRTVVEKAGVYVESYSKTKHMELTEDEVRVLAGSVIRVLDERVELNLIGDVIRYTVYIDAEADPDKVDLQSVVEKRRELERVQKEKEELQKRNEELERQKKEEETRRRRNDVDWTAVITEILKESMKRH